LNKGYNKRAAGPGKASGGAVPQSGKGGVKVGTGAVKREAFKSEYAQRRKEREEEVHSNTTITIFSPFPNDRVHCSLTMYTSLFNRL
jgi:hypothetical protein